jgi:hypothetical protein
VRPRDEHWQVLGLAAEGRNTSQIARTLGIPRSTVRDWLRDPKRPCEKPGPACERCGRPPHVYDALPKPEYSYLLGIYLGDGHIWSSSPGSFRLSIFCDTAYPELIAEIKTAISTLTPGTPINVNRRPGRCVAVITSSPVWSQAFPQHGPGRKHLRPIVLEPWQRKITHAHPKMLLRGLIHSDGCRCINRFRTKLPSGRVAQYEYPRYFFSNLSADIKGIFCEHCDLLGIRWTNANPRYVSVSHRDSVARLDAFIGPKR